MVKNEIFGLGTDLDPILLGPRYWLVPVFSDILVAFAYFDNCHI